MRVLDEAALPEVPLYERFRFLQIFQSNIDEFFMIRIGSQFDFINVKSDVIDWRTGTRIDVIIKELFDIVKKQVDRSGRIYHQLIEELRGQGISLVDSVSLDQVDKKILKAIFDQRLKDILKPVVVYDGDALPEIESKTPHVIVRLKDRDGRLAIGLAMIPEIGDHVIKLPGSGLRYVHVEDVILSYCEAIFKDMKVIGRTIFAVTRNADINFYDDLYDDAYNMRIKVKELLVIRRHLSVDRIEVKDGAPPNLIDFLTTSYRVDHDQIQATRMPFRIPMDLIRHQLLRSFRNDQSFYPAFEPVWPDSLDPQLSVMSQVEKRDILTFLPFESFDPLIRLLGEAATDPDVVSIKITIYRLASKARLIEQLVLAAEHGKDVLVVMELRARFDEMNNIIFSERLERAGCRIIHGFGTHKVHSKLILIVKKPHAKVRRIVQIGTGNYHETTVRQYTDLSLMTAHEGITSDVEHIFEGLEQGNKTIRLNHLIAAPIGFRKTLLNLIAEETRKGTKGRIRLKINAITESELMDALVIASRAGVRIDIIVRSITCLLPGIKHHTEHIHMSSIVGRFLEHARILAFGEDYEAVYLSSADLMTRNVERRIEVATPVYDSQVLDRIKEIFDIQLRDGIKGRKIDASGCHVAADHIEHPIDSQSYFIGQATKTKRQT